ncbi:MAG: hypothetical protein ABI194_01520 [Gemmatimonadaceae bacterium]
MKKLIIPFVAAFGLSLGAATGVVMVRAPKASIPPAAKSAVMAHEPDSAGTVHTAAAATGTATTADSGSAAANIAPNAGATGVAGSVRDPAQPAPSKNEVAAGPSTANHAAVRGAAAAAATGLSSSAERVAVSSVTAQKSVLPPVRPASDSLVGRRLAQVFAAMQSKDAARVLQQMDDNDVRTILGSLSSKQQAAILGSFPTQRAAVLLQATLRTTPGGGRE